MMDVQAAIDPEDGSELRWFSFGDVTHAQAAKLLVEKTSLVSGGQSEFSVRTRWKDSPLTFPHRVSRRVVTEVVPLRGD